MNPTQIVMATIVVAGTTFLLSGLFVFRPRMLELMAQRDEWRARAIAAEDNPTHTQPIVRQDWGDPLPGRLDVAGDGTIVFRDTHVHGEIIDLTDIGDVPDA